jgi:serine/threonine protein kinase
MNLNSHFTQQPDSESVCEDESVIGIGSTSICYKVRYNGKLYSKKRLKTEYKDYQIYKDALRKEFEIGSQIDCPYLVHYSEIGEDKDGPYILTDYVEGITLTEFIAKNPDYFKSRYNRKMFVRELLEAVECLHNHQILHLDLKPDNIVITSIGNHVKLIDYGYSYIDCFPDVIGGTEGYSAPEQFNHQYKVSISSDVYALCSIFDEFHLAEKKIIAKGHKENPSDRYQSIRELRQALNSHTKRNTLISLFLVLICITYSVIYLCEPKHVPAMYSSLRIPIAAKCKMKVTTVVGDSTSQPPLVGGMIEGFDSTEIGQKGILIGTDEEEMFMTDSTKKVVQTDYSGPLQPDNTIVLECTYLGEEQFLLPLRYLKGDKDYYVKAYIVTSNRKCVYGKLVKIHTKDFDRYPGLFDVANVFYYSKYSVFDLMTDELINMDDEGCYYSSNEAPIKCIRNSQAKSNGYYKFKTRWTYLLWYSHWGINNLQWKLKNKYIYKPVMTFEKGTLKISNNPKNVGETLTFYYTINGDWQRPEYFRNVYTAPIAIKQPCIVTCYARDKQGFVSFTNSYKVFSWQINNQK